MIFREANEETETFLPFFFGRILSPLHSLAFTASALTLDRNQAVLELVASLGNEERRTERLE